MGAAIVDVIDASQRPAIAHRWYVTAVLFFVGAFNLMDRQILAILLEPIKRDLALSDTAMGVLTGFAFVAFYTIASVPIARLADAANRRSIIACALAFWSLMTMLSSAAGSFAQLALARLGVGVGESAAGPASQSMLADLHPPKQRVVALSLFATAAPIGVMLAFTLGGWLNDLVGWRTTLTCIGAPGLLLALIVWWTVSEPERGGAETGVTDTAHYEFSAALRYLLQLRSFRWLSLGAALEIFAVMALVVWSPSFLTRVHLASTAEAGLWLGVATGLGGVIGGPLSGWIASRLSQRDAAWLLRLPAITSLLGAPCMALFLLLDTLSVALPMFLASVLCCAAMMGPVTTATQNVARIRMRATAAAVVTLIFNLVGTGLGPLSIGVASDLLAPTLGDDSIRAALLLAVAASLGASVFFYVGARTLRADIERASRRLA
jgi:predicted MFS family arabinose efflux permease